MPSRRFRKIVVGLALAGALVACAAAGAAEPFDTHHTLSLAAGLHNFFPDNRPHRGTRPDDDAAVTDAEWEYLWDEAYRIQDFDSATFELAYEYKFLRWLGVGAGAGIYGREQTFAFRVSGFDVRSRSTIQVFHADLALRFHWLTRWTDLYGGPVVGYYAARTNIRIDATYGTYSLSERNGAPADGVGVGIVAGFELRIVRNFGVALEDRLVVAPVGDFRGGDEGSLNAGGNVLILAVVAHF
jgi:hypothetical protein